MHKPNENSNDMTYKFDVVVFLTYRDKDIKISIDLTDQQVKRIKKLVAEYEPSDEDTPVSKTSLLTILEEDAPNLFNKFWKIIMPQVFLELLINGMKNYGDDMRHDDDPVDNPENYRKIPFKTLYKMYGDDIEIEHSCCCFCKIPKEWI